MKCCMHFFAFIVVLVGIVWVGSEPHLGEVGMEVVGNRQVLQLKSLYRICLERSITFVTMLACRLNTDLTS
jgi:hypothetical protein